MDTNLLLITEQHEFEQLLRLTLDDLDSRLLQYASSNEEALKTATIHPPTIILLDAASVNDASGLAQELLQSHPGSKLILVPPANNPEHPSIRDLKPDKILNNPFSKDDLLEIIADLSGGKILPVTSADEVDVEEDSSSLLDDLKDQLAAAPEALTVITEEESLSLEQELEQVLSQNYAAGDELEDTAIVHVSEEDKIELPPLEENGADDDGILLSVLAQLEDQTVSDAPLEDENLKSMEDIINEVVTEEIDPELDALLDEFEELEPEELERKQQPDEGEMESVTLPTLVPDETPLEEQQTEQPEESEEAEFVWDLKAKLPLPENKDLSAELPLMEETGQTIPKKTEPDAEAAVENTAAEEQSDEEAAPPADVVPEESDRGMLEKIKTALQQNQTWGLTSLLEETAAEYELPGMLLFIQSRILSSTGLLTETDRQEIETMLEQAWKNEDQIDIARFLKLGDPQEKYLLYAAPISGALGLCTLNLTRKPLSEIRSHTLWMAQQLHVDEQDVQQIFVPQAAQPLEVETVAQIPVEQDTEETPHTTLDELLSEESLHETSETTDEYDEWVHEMPESEEESLSQDQVTGSEWEEEEIEPSASSTASMETAFHSEDAGQSQEMDSVETETTELVLDEPSDSGEAAFEQRLKPPEGVITPEDNEAEQLDSSPSEEPADQNLEVPGKIESDAAASRSRSKIGQGRIKLRKSSLEKANLHQWDEEVLQDKFLLVFKPFEYDEEKSNIPVSKPGAEPLDKPESGWKPAPEDPLKRIRHQLKNQKTPPQVKVVKSESKQVAFMKEKRSIKKEIRPSTVFHTLEDRAEETAVSSQDEPLVKEEQYPEAAPLDTAEAEAARSAEIQTEPEEGEHKDWISPPETLTEGQSSQTEQLGLRDTQEDAIMEMAGETPDLSPDLPQTDDHKDIEGPEREESIPPFLEDDEEDEVVIIEENLDLLKELAEDMRFDELGLDEDEDADTFFEAYMSRAGEQIEDEEEPEKSLETPALEMESKEDLAGEEQIPSPELPETGQLETEEEDEDTASETSPLDEFASSEEVDHSAFVELLRDRFAGSEAEIETLEPPNIDEDFSQTIISLQENEDAEEGSPEEETEATASVDLEAGSTSTAAEFDLEDFPVFEEDLEEDEILSSLEKGSSLETWEDMEEADVAEEVLSAEELAVETEGILVTTGEQPESEEDIRKILHEVLSEEEDQEEASPEPSERFEPEPGILTPAAEEPGKEMTATAVEDADSSLDAELLPWEAEGDYAEENIEITPTPSLLAEEDQSADVLVDLLADTRLDTLSLNLEQPLYTCILVPELTEFSLNSKIASRIKEWLPRLSRVFGWQFVNIHVQPTYLQWTVRVPMGTSQGSIVRKVRQQTSLRIFEEFSELKQLSHSGNFWAKGYLVVSGSNPPPAEFLDDFIQKNRRSKGIFGP